jgi:hypothetical protein
MDKDAPAPALQPSYTHQRELLLLNISVLHRRMAEAQDQVWDLMQLTEASSIPHPDLMHEELEALLRKSIWLSARLTELRILFDPLLERRIERYWKLLLDGSDQGGDSLDTAILDEIALRYERYRLYYDILQSDGLEEIEEAHVKMGLMAGESHRISTQIDTLEQFLPRWDV